MASFASRQLPNNNPRSVAALTRTVLREKLGPTYGNTIEADGNLIPRRGWSSIAGPNRVCEVAELNFEGSPYVYMYGCTSRVCMYTRRRLLAMYARCVFRTRRCMHNFLRTNQIRGADKRNGSSSLYEFVEDARPC